MKDAILSRAFRVSDPRAAAALADPERRRLVLLLAGSDRTLAEIARTAELDLKRLHYHVGQLCRLGLVKITGSRRRAGRPVKFYRAVAEAFFVPAEVAASGPSKALATQLDRSLAALRNRTQEGVLYFRSQDSGPQIRAVPDPAAKNVPAAELWRVLRLSRSEATSLARGIKDLVNHHARNQRTTEKSYLVHFAFAPTEPAESNGGSTRLLRRGQ
jgi:predicted ArsR family transcriptional regulator